MSDKTIPADFDAGDRAKRVAASTKIRETIAEDTARLMRHAEKQNWGRCLGSPTLSGGVLVFHFEGGLKGIVQLPTGAKF